MANCSKCNAQMPEGAAACPACGAAGNPVNAAKDILNNVEDFTAQFDPQDIAANKTNGILAYIGFLVLIPFFTAKESPYAQFHVKQGFTLFVLELAYAVVANVLLFILGGIPVLGMILSLVLNLVYIFFVVMLVIGVMNVNKGLAKKLPLIGNIQIIK